MLSRNVLLLPFRIFKNLTSINYQPNFKYVFTVLNQRQIILREYASVKPIAVSEGPYKNIPKTSLKEFKAKNCIGVTYITPTLIQLLDLNPHEVKELIIKCPNFKTTSSDTIQKNYNICSAAGITNETLKQYPLILTLDLLSSKVEILQELDVDINLIAPLLIAKLNDLKNIVENAKVEERFIPHRNRIVYLSKLMNLPAPEICEKIINHPYVLRIPIQRLEMILKVLLDYGVEPRNILNDCWALRYNPKIAEDRLQRAIQANVIKVKTWMIRCTEKAFKRCINRQIENRTILGDYSSVEDYLSKRLECSIENAKYLTEKYPAIRKMNTLKMKEILDFLYEQGYSPIHVCRVPRIMVHSQETTKFRIQQLAQLGYVPPSLAILCKSKRDFDKIIKKYTKRKKNNENNSATVNT